MRDKIWLRWPRVALAHTAPFRNSMHERIGAPSLAKAAPTTDDRWNSLNKVHMQPLSPGHAQFAQRSGIDYVTAAFGQTETGASLSAVIEEVR